ncbi:hypothetical protein RBB56_04665 [Kineothrix sp. MB12-C1]|nr:hypothetical protein [Kineothrix sp. MB12-C1]WMC93579.1 hypothetical protein RBB56_04665 [Kineothrix sp. MB12-C1]
MNAVITVAIKYENCFSRVGCNKYLHPISSIPPSIIIRGKTGIQRYHTMPKFVLHKRIDGINSTAKNTKANRYCFHFAFTENAIFKKSFIVLIAIFFF